MPLSTGAAILSVCLFVIGLISVHGRFRTSAPGCGCVNCSETKR